MPDQHIAPDLSRHGIHVADGYGIQLHVHHRHLIVTDGYGQHRRRTRFHRATHDLKRLVVLGHTGYVTLEAIRWLYDARIPLIQIDSDGRVLVSSRLGSDQPALRRAQATAATVPVGFELIRWILERKIQGQADVAVRLDADAAETIEAHLDQLHEVDTLERLRLVEASAASVYWDLWADIPLRFATNDQQRVPDHWRTVGPRRSPISGSGRSATNPIQAILNYLYALLEAEARIACLAVGLDPGIGILHTDQRDRDSLALDLMEAVRPDIDTYVLSLLGDRVFSTGDFHETRRGIVRILRPLTHELAATTTTWAQRLAPIAEHITRTLSGGTAPTPLTHSNRSRGRDPYRRESRVVRESDPPLPDPRCRDCATPIPNRRTICGECADAAIRNPAHARLERLAELRECGEDPAHGGEAAEKRGTTNWQQHWANSEWERSNTRPDPGLFVAEILPVLDRVSAGAMARATGLSPGYCSQIKNGHRVPHPRHWPSLEQLIKSKR